MKGRARTRRETLAILGAAIVAAASSMTASDPMPDMAAAARAFLAALAPAKRARVSLPFNSSERLKWSYVPMDRAGVPWKEMTAGEREAGLALLRSALSETAFKKVDTIRRLEDVLRGIEGWSM